MLRATNDAFKRARKELYCCRTASWKWISGDAWACLASGASAPALDFGWADKKDH
jgi:hypothetical protein